MNVLKFGSVNAFWSKCSVAFLLLFWTVGFAVGTLCVFSLYDNYGSIIRQAAAMDATIVGLLLLSMVPLVLSYIVIRLSAAPLLLPISFFKALSFAFCSFGVLWAYGSAGWLVRILLLFSDSLSVLILLYFWISSITGDRKFIDHRLLCCMIASGFVAIVDYLYIVPLLHSVFSKFS